MATYTFTGTATAATDAEAEALAKQNAEDEALLSQGAFVTQTSYNEVVIRLNDDGTYTATFTLKVTDETPVDSAADLVPVVDANVATTPSNAVTNQSNAQTVANASANKPPILNTTGSTSPQPGTPSSTFATSSNMLDPGNQNAPDTSYIYQAIEVLSIFSKGQFIQEIQGAQKFWEVPQNSTSNQGRPSTTPSGAGGGQSTPEFAANDPRRLDRKTTSAEASNETSEPLPANDWTDPMGTGDAGAIIAAQSNGASSNGQNVAPSSASNNAPVYTSITLIDGSVQTVTSVEQVNALFNSGRIGFKEAGIAITTLQSLTAAKNRQTSTNGAQLMATEK